MQQPQRCQRITAEIREMILRKIEGQGDAAHQPLAEVEHGGKIGDHRRPEAGQVGGPQVGAAIEPAGRHPGIGLRQFETDIETLLAVRQRPGFQGLTAQDLVAAIARGTGLVHPHLDLQRLVEKPPGFGKHSLDQTGRNAVVRAIEKALVQARLP